MKKLLIERMYLVDTSAKKGLIMSPAWANCPMLILIYLTLCTYAVTSVDLVLKEGDFYNFTCTSTDDNWYVTNNGFPMRYAYCQDGTCATTGMGDGVTVGLLDKGGTFFYMPVSRDTTEVSCFNANWNLIITDITVTELKLVTPVLPRTPVVTVDVGIVLTFSCTGRGPPGTKFIISTDTFMVSVWLCEPLNIGASNVAYCSMRVDICGISFDVNCQAEYDSTTKQTIQMSSSSCPNLVMVPDPPYFGSTVSTPYTVWPFASSGVFIAVVTSSVCLACRLRRARRQAAMNARRANTTTTLEPLPQINVSCTDASMEPPYAAAVSNQGSLPPAYSVIIHDPGKYRIPTAASLGDQPPQYESLLNQQATPK